MAEYSDLDLERYLESFFAFVDLLVHLVALERCNLDLDLVWLMGQWVQDDLAVTSEETSGQMDPVVLD